MSVSIIIRPPGATPYVVTLERLTQHLRAATDLMAISRDDLKKKRLQAMGSVAAEMQENADMYDRITAARANVAAVRVTAEQAHMAAMAEQVADLKEMAEEMAEFAQAVPPNGGTDGVKLPASTTAPAAAMTTPSGALAALQATAPANLPADAWQNQRDVAEVAEPNFSDRA